jgi:hypothetical protein
MLSESMTRRGAARHRVALGEEDDHGFLPQRIGTMGLIGLDRGPLGGLHRGLLGQASPFLLFFSVFLFLL